MENTYSGNTHLYNFTGLIHRYLKPPRAPDSLHDRVENFEEINNFLPSALKKTPNQTKI